MCSRPLRSLVLIVTVELAHDSRGSRRRSLWKKCVYGRLDVAKSRPHRDQCDHMCVHGVGSWLGSVFGLAHGRACGACVFLRDDYDRLSVVAADLLTCCLERLFRSDSCFRTCECIQHCLSRIRGAARFECARLALSTRSWNLPAQDSSQLVHDHSPFPRIPRRIASLFPQFVVLLLESAMARCIIEPAMSVGDGRRGPLSLVLVRMAASRVAGGMDSAACPSGFHHCSPGCGGFSGRKM